MAKRKAAKKAKKPKAVKAKRQAVMSDKCVKCGAPFKGVLSRLFGMKRSTSNPNYCNKCSK